MDLDIKSPDDTATHELIARSDIVINNLRPGAMERQGLGYEQLTAIKPDIIDVSIRMWGNVASAPVTNRLCALLRGAGRPCVACR